MRAPDPSGFWLAALGPGSRPLRDGVEPDTRHEGRQWTLRLWHGTGAAPRAAGRDGVAVVLAGRPEHDVDAETLLDRYLATGARPWRALRGDFALVLWDDHEGSVEVVRDHFGVQPLFHAERDGFLVVSASPDAVARCGLLPPAPDPLAVAHWVVDGCTHLEETFYAGVRRLPPGHRLTWRGGPVAVERWWRPDLAPGDGGAVGAEAAAARFEEALDRAVARCVRGRAAAVFLSGGVDSVAVAASACATGAPPVALSLAFPDAESNEEPAQRALAAALGLEQQVVPLADALGGEQLLRAGLEHTRRSWHPCVNPWEPAYADLARRAAGLGCEVVVGGSGGNELLEIPWGWPADLLRRGDVREVRRFAAALAAYSGGAPRDYAVDLAWSAGLRPLARDGLVRLLSAVHPAWLRSLRAARRERALPGWSLPEPRLRARFVEQWEPPAAAGLAAARRSSLDSPYDAVLAESWHLVSRTTGIELRAPLFDPDLAELVLALPPSAVMLDGRVKGIARERVRRALGDAAVAHFAAVGADRLFAAALRAEAPAALSALGGLPALTSLGAVDGPRAVDAFDRLEAYERWQLLATEAWLQDRFAQSGENGWPPSSRCDTLVESRGSASVGESVEGDVSEQPKIVPERKAAYEPPVLRRVGTFGDVMQGGSMKMGEPGPGMRSKGTGFPF